MYSFMSFQPCVIYCLSDTIKQTLHVSHPIAECDFWGRIGECSVLYISENYHFTLYCSKDWGQKDCFMFLTKYFMLTKDAFMCLKVELYCDPFKQAVFYFKFQM